MKAVEAGRRRANGVERAFFSHLVETEALMLQRERLMQPGHVLEISRRCGVVGGAERAREHVVDEDLEYNNTPVEVQYPILDGT